MTRAKAKKAGGLPVELIEADHGCAKHSGLPYAVRVGEDVYCRVCAGRAVPDRTWIRTGSPHGREIVEALAATLVHDDQARRSDMTQRSKPSPIRIHNG